MLDFDLEVKLLLEVLFAETPGASSSRSQRRIRAGQPAGRWKTALCRVQSLLKCSARKIRRDNLSRRRYESVRANQACLYVRQLQSLPEKKKKKKGQNLNWCLICLKWSCWLWNSSEQSGGFLLHYSVCCHAPAWGRRVSVEHLCSRDSMWTGTWWREQTLQHFLV